jgi:endogenous inhibitor of DNA gyrase (YacG/DUF329 family)
MVKPVVKCPYCGRNVAFVEEAEKTEFGGEITL